MTALADCLLDLPEGVSDLEGVTGPVLVLAHGAGAPMDSEWMNKMTSLFVASGVAVVRFEFDYMAERRNTGKRRPPERQPKLLEKWRNVVELVAAKVASDTLWIGGKSMGGRMATLIADEVDVEGVIALGYPFYAPKKQEKPRTKHLETLKSSCLIVQGTRDPMGSIEVVSEYALSSSIRFCWLEDGDHDFKPRRKSGFTQDMHLESAVKAVLSFLQANC